jgi:putative DNA primase/helicase
MSFSIAYRRGGMLVRPVLSEVKAAKDRDTLAWRLIPVTHPYMAETLTCAARFLRYDGRAKDWKPIDAPDKVVQAYLAREGEWRVPILAGVVNAPFLRADGSICEQPGYDAASGLLFKPDDAFPAIPQNPTKIDAIEALRHVDKLIDTFPFVTPADRSVVLSGILTALDRRSMATAPMHAFTAPEAGSGKSLLIDIISAISTGMLAPVISQGRTEEELEKRLGAALIHGAQLISIDNCEHPLGGVFLCQALTQQRLNIRVLGLSKIVEVPVNAMIIANGNNLVIIGDLVRRTLLCAIDAHCERPELREFDFDVIEVIKADRGRLVAAALTALRAWHVSGTRGMATPLGGFEEWSHRIREPLLWLGYADPCETAAKIRESDPGRASLAEVHARWKEKLGPFRAYTAQEIINEALMSAEFQNVLKSVAANLKGNVDNVSLGRWLNKVKGKIIGGTTIERHAIKQGCSLWKLVE